MYFNKLLIKLAISLSLFLFNSPVNAQEKKVAKPTQELINEIANMDSVLFEAFNSQNMDKFKPLFTEDLEWYQDNGGLISHNKVFENFANTFKKEFKLTRRLVQGSMEVFPIKDYGAIETGTHQFLHIENGKQEIGTFKFVMIWKKINEHWQISRVISYGH
ncbi:MAG: nuclear transport factor 2 family protein [Ferruginibacter sp.]|nr:nuclear transport factor 2 family protein [Ferruginibacter sp.]